MGISRIAFFVYFVKDMARAKAFYQDILNLEVERDTGAWVQFKMEGGTFALHLKDEDAGEHPAHGTGGMVGFAVDDLDAFVSRLQQHEVELQGEIREERFGRLVNILDPDGNLSNLFEPAKVPAGVH